MAVGLIVDARVIFDHINDMPHDLIGNIKHTFSQLGICHAGIAIKFILLQDSIHSILASAISIWFGMMAAYDDIIGICETHTANINKDMIWVGLQVISKSLYISIIMPIQFILMLCQLNAIWCIIYLNLLKCWLFSSFHLLSPTGRPSTTSHSHRQFRIHHSCQATRPYTSVIHGNQYLYLL